MKKLIITTCIILAMIVVGVYFISSSKKDTDITKNQTKVGFVLNGTIDDGSWGQSHYEGMEIAAKDLNLNVMYHENTPEGEECIEVIEDFIAKGCKIIFCNSFGFGEYELQVAEKHPDVRFFHATGVQEASNLSTYFGRIYQMRYLCGVVAGLQTKTNEIGYVAAFDISEVNRGINAFTLGVKSVNKDATVRVKFCNSWIDDDASRDAFKELENDYGIDVVTVHTDSLTVYEEAEKDGVWIIGYNEDNSEKYPNCFLTAAVWRWEKFYTARITEVLQDKFESKHYWEGIETGLVDLAPFTEHVVPLAQSIVDAKKQALTNGEFDVFYGPIYDNEGNLRIAEGESMTDDNMLNAFDWYVDGVEIDE